MIQTMRQTLYFLEEEVVVMLLLSFHLLTLGLLEGSCKIKFLKILQGEMIESILLAYNEAQCILFKARTTLERDVD
jgi:hypothetical protein